MVNCPYGCVKDDRWHHTMRGKKVGLRNVHRQVSKSGKSLQNFYHCPSCDRVFRTDKQIIRGIKKRKEDNEQP